jgi:hypothetical protein
MASFNGRKNGDGFIAAELVLIPVLARRAKFVAKN